MKQWLCGVFLLTLGLATLPARSQATLDTNIKVQIVTAVVAEAEKAMTGGKRDLARFYLLGITEVADKLRTRLPQEVAAKYNAVAAAAWPKPDENLATLAQTVKDAAPVLTRYGIMTNFMSPHDTMGFDAWARFVIGAQAIYPDAEKAAVAYAAKVPHPSYLLTPAGVNAGAYALFPNLFNILLDESLAKEAATKDILPNSLKKGQAVLDGVSPDEKSPDTLWLAAGQIDTYAGYALTIDPKNADATTLKEKTKALVIKANALYAAQVKSNRLPADAYKGDTAAEFRTKMTAAYTKSFPKDTVLKLAITSDNWVEFAEAWSEGDTIKAGVFRAVTAAVAVERPDKKIWVYYVRFRRQWTGSGDTFGEVYLSGVLGTSYEMLKENIK
ncbi:MAG TPA: hypothetical protein VGM23_01720 [Armatimonadota bacterium]|jgi:hypothetical protein